MGLNCGFDGLYAGKKRVMAGGTDRVEASDFKLESSGSGWFLTVVAAEAAIGLAAIGAHYHFRERDNVALDRTYVGPDGRLVVDDWQSIDVGKSHQSRDYTIRVGATDTFYYLPDRALISVTDLSGNVESKILEEGVSYQFFGKLEVKMEQISSFHVGLHAVS